MDHKKRDLANRTVRDWQLRLKKKKLKKGKCPSYAPSSLNVERRTFLSTRMACDYEWQWNENSLLGFDGCLDSAITSGKENILKALKEHIVSHTSVVDTEIVVESTRIRLLRG